MIRELDCSLLGACEIRICAIVFSDALTPLTLLGEVTR